MPLLSIPGLQSGPPLTPGGIANTLPHEAHTCLHSTANVDAALGGIPFGRGCTVSTLPAGVTYRAYDRLAVQLAATGAKFAGVAMFSDAVVGILNGKPEDYTSARGYLPDRELPLVYRGLVGVEVNQAVTPGSPVFVVVTPGLEHGMFRADANSGAAIAVTGASFRGSAAIGGTVALYLDLVI